MKFIADGSVVSAVRWFFRRFSLIGKAQFCTCDHRSACPVPCLAGVFVDGSCVFDVRVLSSVLCGFFAQSSLSPPHSPKCKTNFASGRSFILVLMTDELRW